MCSSGCWLVAVDGIAHGRVRQDDASQCHAPCPVHQQMVTATRLLPRCDINMLVLPVSGAIIIIPSFGNTLKVSPPRRYHASSLHGQLSRGSVRDNPPIVAKRQVEATFTNIVPRDARILSPGLHQLGTMH